LYEEFIDSVRKIGIHEQEDLAKSFENQILIERENHDLEQKSTQSWIILIGVTVLFVVTCYTLYILTQRKKKYFLKQEENLQMMLRRTKELDGSLIRENQQKIRALYQENSAYKEKLSDIRQEKNTIEAELLELRNCQLEKEKCQRQLLKIGIRESEVYKRFFDSGCEINQKDLIELEKLVDELYPSFKEELNGIYSKMNPNEIGICYMSKIELSVKRMGVILHLPQHNVTVMRSRLYAKMFGKKGRSADFENFILSL